MRNAIKVTIPNGRWMHVMHVGIGIYVHLYWPRACSSVWVNGLQENSLVHLIHSFIRISFLTLSPSVIKVVFVVIFLIFFSSLLLYFLSPSFVEFTLLSMQTIVHQRSYSTFTVALSLFHFDGTTHRTERLHCRTKSSSKQWCRCLMYMLLFGSLFGRTQPHRRIIIYETKNYNIGNCNNIVFSFVYIHLKKIKKGENMTVLAFPCHCSCLQKVKLNTMITILSL